MRIGVDIGGTFTDFVVFEPETGAIWTFKLPSSPEQPARAMLDGLETLPSETARQIVHGSTVATNALLEHKGARTGLVATRGFRDVLQIARQNRPSLYDFFADPPEPLVPREWRLEIDERVNHLGEVQTALNPDKVDELIARFQKDGIESIAICLLFSFLHPEHEMAIAEKLRGAGFFVSASCEVLPEFREYERTSTTVVNAYVSPVMGRYLADLESKLSGDDLRIMQSNGGSISPSEAQHQAVRCILSGPAGGVVGALEVGQQAGFERLITFDMGGTSTDVSLCDGGMQVTSEAEVGGFPIRVPIIDIHTVGAGGGSIARVDAGGALRVGPESAGADPGPACYGLGEQATVTDANLVLGRLMPERFLGGAMKLDVPRAETALEKLGDTLGLSPEAAALGVVEVVNAHMERALRVISVERGHDPRDFALVSFGGAGGLHAADLARRLGIPTVVVPPQAATLSALGMLMADVIKDCTQTVMLPGDTPLDEIERRFAPLTERGQEELLAEGIARDDIVLERLLDMRYRGQSYELSVPFGEGVMADFEAKHEAAFGYAQPGEPVEVVNLRVRAVGRVAKPEIEPQPVGDGDVSRALLGRRRVTLAQGVREIPLYDGERLKAGDHLPSPAIVVRPDTTILLQEGDEGEVDGYLNLIIKI